MHPFEKIRKQHKPEKVKLLYIAESRPDGGTFFYNYNSKLFFALKEAWDEYLGKTLSNQEYLSLFVKTGCYLEDLCTEPVNKLSPGERQKKRKEGIPQLASKIKQYNPDFVIILMKGIIPHVQEAIKLSECNINFIRSTSFPAHSKENEINCITANTAILKELNETGKL